MGSAAADGLWWAFTHGFSDDRILLKGDDETGEIACDMNGRPFKQWPSLDAAIEEVVGHLPTPYERNCARADLVKAWPAARRREELIELQRAWARGGGVLAVLLTIRSR